jgi:Delta7-sterol 5-desaturase
MTIAKYLFFLLQILSRYFIIAGVFFLLFYVIYKSKWSYKKIQKIFPQAKDYRREILNSLFSIGLFALIPALFFKNPDLRPYTQLYDEIAEKGWLYYFLAFPIMAFLHDTYFYWMHRLLHTKLLYKKLHLTHHLSANPSPWSAYSFSFGEAIVEVGIFVIFIFIMPLHKTHIFFFFLFSFVYNVYGHLGWELYPKGFSKNWFGKWMNTSVNHNMHHKYVKGNYSLYFLFWDRWMNTLREDYDAQYDEVKNRQAPLPTQSNP